MEASTLPPSIDPTGLLRQLHAFLLLSAPRDTLIPIPLGLKRPAVKYGGASPWGEEGLAAYARGLAASGEGSDWAIGLRELCVLDVDDPALAAPLEARFPALRAAPCERTRRGLHYFFRRSALADAGGYFDSCGTVTPHLDFKSLTATGTPGILVCAPSTDKVWVRPPWEAGLAPIPDDLLVHCARPSAGGGGGGGALLPARVHGEEAAASPLAAPLPLAALEAASGLVRLRFEGEAPSTPPLLLHPQRLAPFAFFAPLLSGRWSTASALAVPLGRALFLTLLCALERGDTPALLMPPTPALLAALAAAGDALALEPAQLARHLLLPAPHAPRLSYRADLYALSPAWWRVDAEEEARMAGGKRSEACAALVRVDEALAGALRYAPPQRARGGARGLAWLFPTQPLIVGGDGAGSAGRPVLNASPARAMAAALPPLVLAVLREHAGVLVLAGGAVTGAVGRACAAGADFDLFLHSCSPEEGDAVVERVSARAAGAGYAMTCSKVAITFTPPPAASGAGACAAGASAGAAGAAPERKAFQLILCLHSDRAQILENFDLPPAKAMAYYAPPTAAALGAAAPAAQAQAQLVVEALPSWVECMRCMAFWVDTSAWSVSAVARVCKYVAKGFECAVPGVRRGALAAGQRFGWGFGGSSEARREVAAGDFSLTSLFNAEAAHVYGTLGGGGGGPALLLAPPALPAAAQRWRAPRPPPALQQQQQPAGQPPPPGRC